jgi:hypothetical protein
MSGNYGLDPVSAISEAEATGEAAMIFADIRETMQLPLLTSIWRTLVGIPGGLPAAWAAAKPLYQTGQPAAALLQFREQALLPVPTPLVPGQLACAGVSPHDLPAIRTVIDAYNRSNGLNLIALTGLIAMPSGAPPNDPVPPALQPWPELPPLLAEADMTVDTWTLLQQINRFGAARADSGLATLWRHLAHWPGLLALIDAGFSPLHQDGTIQRSIVHALEFAQAAGASIAHLRQQPASLPVAAREMITTYVLDPGKVARMVAIGHGLAHWLRTLDEQQ